MMDSHGTDADSHRGSPGPNRSWRRYFFVLLVVLLAVDALFIGLDVVLGETPGFPEVLHVYHEGGIPEWYQYLEFAAGAVLMFALARRTVGLYAVWGAVFVYLLLDDMFMGHERVAGHTVRLLRLDERLDLPFEAWVLLEPLYQVFVGLGILAALFFVARRSSSPRSRRFSIHALALLILLGVFSAFGDFIGRVVFDGAHMAEVVEDGGEMVAGSLLLARVFYEAATEVLGPRMSRGLPRQADLRGRP